MIRPERPGERIEGHSVELITVAENCGHLERSVKSFSRCTHGLCPVRPEFQGIYSAHGQSGTETSAGSSAGVSDNGAGKGLTNDVNGIHVLRELLPPFVAH